ncbi:histidinol dehydrogenase [Motilibacter rhizosphaerae]|uniref:histidinol dehydrogenase n=1 Tax=Motilibacter rhizosphaerae TaxID=598652 RepID=UPI00102AF303
MLPRVDLRGRTHDEELVASVLPRAALDVSAAVELVRPIVEDVRARGAAAVREATARIDGIDAGTTRVPAEALAAALADLDPAVRAALEESIRRARLVHEAQRRPDEVVEVAPGGTVTERWVPVRRVGLYVPGGLCPLPSSVVMNVVPAQVAGVRSLAVVSPPQREHGGLPHPVVLAACALLGVEEVHAVGGAQAVAMLAYGTEQCRKVDMVTGPGNVYVAAAKRLVRGAVGIDSEAGPTEIGILADETADPVFVAADLLSQAEHDPNASCLLVSPSEELLDAVAAEVERQFALTKHVDRVGPALRSQSAAVLVDDIDAGLALVDEWAAEHLEVITRDAAAVAARVTNAGAVFVGPWSPVSLGDYLAGSNHVLPTGGTAKFNPGLSVQTFLRGIHVVDYSRDALAAVAHHIDALGGAEDLVAHVAAVRVRVPAEEAGA